jgi:NitT/TauT family transport system substrate-binding protein
MKFDTRHAIRLAALAFASVFIAACSRDPAAKSTPATDSAAASAAPFVLRVGHFPNVTHVQAVIARSFTRGGKGWFESRLGPDVKIEWYSYNAGPSAMEAIFAKSLDLTYVGPNPAINAYSRAGGEEIRVVAGAVNGGSALVVQADSALTKPADFRGKRIGTPQLGNTQDIAARAWLADGGLTISQLGGDAQVIPTANADQLSLFKQRQLDAVWTVEPWVSRLELEADGKLLIDDRDAVTTVLVSTVALLTNQRELVRRFVVAHRQLSEWIQANPAEAQQRLVAELAEQTRGAISATVVSRAWPRMTLTTDITLEPFTQFQQSALASGLLANSVDLSRLVETP